MNYFKYEYWMGTDDHDSAEDVDRLWQIGVDEYVMQLERLQPKLSARNYRFFRYDSLHDGYVTSVIITDENAVRTKKAGRYIDVRRQARPVTVVLEVLSREYAYTLKFAKVSKFSLNSPHADALPGSSEFGDWGYAELTGIAEGTFRYEILFASGTILLIEFASFRYGRKKFMTG